MKEGYLIYLFPRIFNKPVHRGSVNPGVCVLTVAFEAPLTAGIA